MKVRKRDGTLEPVQLDKVSERIRAFSDGLPSVDPIAVATKVVQSLKEGIETERLDGITCEICAVMNMQSPEYGSLAGRLAKDNLRKKTPKTFSLAMDSVSHLLNKEFIAAVESAGSAFDDVVAKTNFECSYRSFLCLCRSYLLRNGNTLAETPEYLFARVALCTHFPDMEKVEGMLQRLVRGEYIHATPTLFNSGTRSQQLSSCFLLTVDEDSVEGIFKTLTKCALISKCSGGIGLDFTMVRARGSKIHSTNGVCSGIVPALRIFNAGSVWIDQSGKRNGAWAVYLEPWHKDVMEFLELRLNTGHEKARARDLFYGLWTPDLFYRRVHNDQHFTLFCPTEAEYQGSNLHDLYGDEFETAYEALEKQGLGRAVRARDIWDAILKACIETGAMYIMNKDTVNRKNPQQNLGPIRCSNLCTEVTLFTSRTETAVCNLATLSLPNFLLGGADMAPLPEDASSEEMHARFDYQNLIEATQELVVNLNRIIDLTTYPVPEAELSNKRHRPIGIGVQGLGDLFHALLLSPTSPLARELNARIFETVYFAAVTASMNLAKTHGPYESFAGSPASQGILQFDFWEDLAYPLHYPWGPLKEEVKVHGLRNSTLISPPPTVSTSTILGNSESIEIPPNFVLSKSLSGESAIVNPRLVQHLSSCNQWNSTVRDAIIKDGGSVQQLAGIPQRLKDVFKTVWEVLPLRLVDHERRTCAFCRSGDQFQSLCCTSRKSYLRSFQVLEVRAKGNLLHQNACRSHPLRLFTTPDDRQFF